MIPKGGKTFKAMGSCNGRLIFLWAMNPPEGDDPFVGHYLLQWKPEGISMAFSFFDLKDTFQGLSHASVVWIKTLSCYPIFWYFIFIVWLSIGWTDSRNLYRVILESVVILTRLGTSLWVIASIQVSSRRL